MSKEKAVPEVRFKGFEGVWEEKKLGKIACFSKGHGYSKSDICKSGIPIILYGRLYTNYKVVIESIDTYACDLPNSVYSTGIEVIVPASGESAEDIARASAVKISGALLGGDLNIIKAIEEIDSIFLALSISNGEIQKELSKKAQGKSVVHLRNSDLKEVEFCYPNKTEQTRIGEFFRNLDARITLEQRKHEKLQNIKKAMLKKMFPKSGATVPEVRFKGFGGEWEEKFFSEFVNRNSVISEQYGLPRIEYEDIVSGSGELNKDIFAKESNKKGVIFESGDVLFGKLRPYLQNWMFSKFMGIAVGDWWVLRANRVDNLFLFSLIQTTKYQRIANLSTGTKMPRADWRVVSSTKFAMPVDTTEQTRIGDFFRNLDSLITLQQRKCEKLQNIKKAMLGKMFV